MSIRIRRDFRARKLFGALAAFAQQLLQDIIMCLQPMPVAAQAPTINDIANQVNCVCIVVLEKVEKEFGLRSFRSQMGIGKKDCPIMLRRRLSSHNLACMDC